MNSIPIWTVRVPARVAKALLKFPRQDEAHIRAALREFEADPWRGDIVKLEGEPNGWRRRVGSYRIFYSISHEKRLVEVTHIKRRTSDIY